MHSFNEKGRFRWASQHRGQRVVDLEYEFNLSVIGDSCGAMFPEIRRWLDNDPIVRAVREIRVWKQAGRWRELEGCPGVRMLVVLTDDLLDGPRARRMLNREVPWLGLVDKTDEEGW